MNKLITGQYPREVNSSIRFVFYWFVSDLSVNAEEMCILFFLGYSSNILYRKDIKRKGLMSGPSIKKCDAIRWEQLEN